MRHPRVSCRKRRNRLRLLRVRHVPPQLATAHAILRNCLLKGNGHRDDAPVQFGQRNIHCDVQRAEADVALVPHRLRLGRDDRLQDWHIKLLQHADVPVGIRIVAGLQSGMVAHGETLRAYHHINRCFAVRIHQVLAEYRPVVLAQAGTEDRQRVASLPFQGVHHRVHKLQVLADPVCAVKEQRRCGLVVITGLSTILVERHSVQTAHAVHAVLRQRDRRLVAVLTAQRFVAQELQQVDDIGNTAVVQVLERRLRYDRRRSRTPLEHRIAHRLTGACDQRNTKPTAFSFQCAKMLAHCLVAAEQACQHQARIWKGIASECIECPLLLH